ncbi:MAG: LamG-like jellyroll fold domain-containing protein, partial [Bryobacteraceae bacterium]
MPTLTSLLCSPASLSSGGSSTCTVMLSQAATASTTVTLSDNNTLLTEQSSVVVPAGGTSATFTATAGSVTSSQTAVVTATLGSSTKTASLTLLPPLALQSLSCSPSSVVSGGSSTCTVTLNQAAAAASLVTLSDNNAALTVPASTTVASGATNSTFLATAGTIASMQTATVTATLGGNTQTAAVTLMPPGTGMISSYGFAEGTGTSTTDVSGDGNTGQLQSATWTTSGKNGSAISLNGTSGYVDIGNGPTLQGTGSMTWSAWIKASAHPSDDGQIIAKSDDGSGWQLKTSADTGVRTFGIAISPDGVLHTQRYSKTVLSLNTWYNVAGVYNAAAKTLDIYVNGVLDNGTLLGTVPASQVIPAVNASVGKRVNGYYFNGVIDDVRIYSRSLSQAEIQGDMSAPAEGAGGTGSPAISSLGCNPAAVASGGSSTCTVTLNQAATTATPVTINDNSTALTVPATVTVATGASSATFAATAGTVTTSQTAVVTAILGTSSQTASLTITPVTSILSLGCAPSSIVSAGTSTCTVTLNQAATAATSITLSDNSTALTVPATVTVAAGASNATFTATAATVTATQVVVVTAAFGTSSQTASLTITPSMGLITLGCTPSIITSGGTSTCTVTLNQAAKAATAVTLSDNSSALTVPASVTVATGASSATFVATAATVTTSQVAVVTATMGTSSQSTSLTIAPALSLLTLGCTPSSVSSGGTSTCTVTLNQAATATTPIAVSDNSSALTVPASVTVAAGATSATFVATAGTVTASQVAVVTATLGSSLQTASLTITPSVTLLTLGCTPSSVSSGGTSTCTLTLKQAATAATSVTLSDNSAALTLPSSVTVAAGASSATFVATAGTVTASQVAVVTATVGTSSQTASITITPVISILSLGCAPSSILSGGTSACSVTLNQAVASATAVSLSDNSSALTEPATVTVAAGATAASFTATASTVTVSQTVIVTATLGTSSLTATLTVVPPSTGVLSAYPFSEGTGTTTADVSGNGNTGQLQGATWTTSGKYGSALSFNGSSSYVDLRNGSSFQTTGSMTWSAWVKAVANPYDDGQIVAKSDDGTGWQLKTTPDTGVRTFGVAVSSSTGAHTQRYSKTVLSLNTWYNVAGVYNATAKTLDIYVNGVLDNGVLNGTIAGSQVIPALNATIGKRSGGFYFNGTIDELRIYSRALSQTEIQSDMQAAIPAYLPALPKQITAIPSGGTTRTSGLDAATVVQAQPSITGLFCSPKAGGAGSAVSCEVHLKASSSPSVVQLTSSSIDVKVPAVVTARAFQTRLAFQVILDRVARQQSAVIAASVGASRSQDTVLVLPASAPILNLPGTLFAKWGTTVSFAANAVDSTDLPLQLTATGLPAGAAFDPASGRFQWTPNATQPGRFDVLFRATDTAGRASAGRVAIEVASGVPVLTTLPEQLACSPNSIVSLHGKWLSTADSFTTDETGTALQLAGTRVTVNGQDVPVLLSSPTEVAFLCPVLAAGSELSVAVETSAGISTALKTQMQGASPRLLTRDGSTDGQGLVTFDGSSDVLTARDYRMQGHPAAPGDRIAIWATGLQSAVVAPMGG